MKKDILIPAAINGTPGVYTENFSDPGFSIVSTTAGFQIVIGSQAAQSLASGMPVGAASGPALGLVTFQNTSSSDIHVTLGDFALARATTIQAAAGSLLGSNSKSYDVGSVISPTGVVLPGTDSQGRQRKIVYITNFGLSSFGSGIINDVILVSVNGGFTGAVFSGSVQSFETTADLQLDGWKRDLSSRSTNLLAGVIEVFYSKPLQTDQ